MKYCKNCGGQAEDGDLYCGYCGSKLNDDAQHVSKSAKQDFEEETTASIAEDFDKEFDDEFERNFNQNNTADNQRNATDNSEFESYVEHGNPFCSYSTPNGSHKKLKYNKIANDANTYGILSFIFGILGGVLGIVFGIIGLTKASKALRLCNTGEYDGKPKATNGKVLSIVGIVLSVFTILFLYPRLNLF